MKNSWLAGLMCGVVAFSVSAQDTPSSAPAPVAEKGKMLVAANGSHLAPVFRVAPDGSAQIIIDGKIVTVPANTLSVVNGKLTTNLTKSAVLALH